MAGSATQAADSALLIGVTQYPSIGRKLEGPGNDLRLMQSALQQLGVQAPRIEVLTDAASDQTKAQGMPTRANILLALQRLVVRATPGSWAVVYFSGHGTQVPQTLANRARYQEPDGLDSVFLPHDVARWNPQTREVVGAISDDQIGLALRKMAQRGVKVWAIFDTCHAGDMTRGAAAHESPASVSRHVPAAALGVPSRLPSYAVLKATSVATSVAKNVSTNGAQAPAAQPPFSMPTGSPGWVATYASQRDEAAGEELFSDPMQPGATKRFGVLTYHLTQQAKSNPASFAELEKALQLAFRDRPFPTPYFEGTLHRSLPNGR